MREGQNRYSGDIDFEALRETTERLGYTSALATRIEHICIHCELRTYGDVVDAYIARRKEQEEKDLWNSKRRKIRKDRVEPIGCERLKHYRNLGELAAKVLNAHLREKGINLE